MADLKLRLAERQKDKDELQKAYESLMDLSHDEKTVIKIRFENLLPYCDHPYQVDPSAVLDLCEDIKENGLICPIIVRRKDGLFEILSGHCRTAAMQLAGYDEIDAYVIKATDEEAANIVIQSNLKQRKTILPSEYAKSLKLRNQYLISNKEKPLYSADKKVCSPMGNGGRVCLQLEKEFNISKSDIFRYIKLNNLINELLNLVDDRKLDLRSAVALSGLAEIDQKIVYQYFYVEHSGKMDMRTAEKIKELVKRLILRGGSVYNKNEGGDKMCDKALLNRILNDFTVRVKKQFGNELKEVILYGSYARGDYDEESDVDIAIMLDITHEAASSSDYRKPVVDILYEIDQEYGYAVLLSPVILSFSFFNDWKGAMPFYQNIERDGVILNA